MSWVAGVDGCRAGWVTVLFETGRTLSGSFRLELCAGFEEILELTPRPKCIAIDIPIGLLDEPQTGGRLCDREARRLLGRRASSVFNPPPRRIMRATTYPEVRGYGLSRQGFNIMPKIREVDRSMNPKLQSQVFEAHPELAFRNLSQRSMQHSKKTPPGHRERLSALSRAHVPWVKDLLHCFKRSEKPFPRNQVAEDDILDAAVLAYTACRIMSKTAMRVPSNPPRDRKGLRMEIWY